VIDNYEKEKNTNSLPEFFVMLQEFRDNIDRQEGCSRTQVVEDDTEQVSEVLITGAPSPHYQNTNNKRVSVNVLEKKNNLNRKENRK
jgi:hypothetical protein